MSYRVILLLNNAATFVQRALIAEKGHFDPGKKGYFITGERHFSCFEKWGAPDPVSPLVLRPIGMINTVGQI